MEFAVPFDGAVVVVVVPGSPGEDVAGLDVPVVGDAVLAPILAGVSPEYARYCAKVSPGSDPPAM